MVKSPPQMWCSKHDLMISLIGWVSRLLSSRLICRLTAKRYHSDRLRVQIPPWAAAHFFSLFLFPLFSCPSSFLRRGPPPLSTNGALSCYLSPPINQANRTWRFGVSTGAEQRLEVWKWCATGQLESWDKFAICRTQFPRLGQFLTPIMRILSRWHKRTFSNSEEIYHTKNSPTPWFFDGLIIYLNTRDTRTKERFRDHYSNLSYDRNC